MNSVNEQQICDLIGPQQLLQLRYICHACKLQVVILAPARPHPDWPHMDDYCMTLGGLCRMHHDAFHAARNNVCGRMVGNSDMRLPIPVGEDSWFGKHTHAMPPEFA